MANQYWQSSYQSQPGLQLEHEFPYPENAQQNQPVHPAQFRSDSNGFSFQSPFPPSNDYQSNFNDPSYASGQQSSGDSFGFAPSMRSSSDPQYPGSSSMAYTSGDYSFTQQPAHVLNNSESRSRPPYLSASPPPMHPQQSHSSQQANYPSSAVPTGRPPKTKRPRIPDPVDDVLDDDIDLDIDGPPDTGKDKAKPPGACARCKNLKVRCEFKTDTDPCKRCLNGGHECVTPGRKKRRTPPKREHLLNQIREQAEEIQKLMTKLTELERTNKRPDPLRLTASGTSETLSESHSLHSPALSPSTSHESSSFPSSAPTAVDSVVSPEKKKDVEDWIAKARESLAEFGGLIGVGMPKSYIVDEDPEDSPSSGEDYADNGLPSAPTGEYEFAVVDSDADDSSGETTARKAIRKQRSHTSFSSNRSKGSSGTRKKDSGASDKLATLPSGAVPFGLMAELSLKKHRQRGSRSSAEDEGDSDGKELQGVANNDFFRGSPAPDPTRARLDDSLQGQAPHILTRGVITPAEAEGLFKTFFDKMNMSLSLVDPVLYTAQRTFHRSPFLFTVICAIGSRYRPDNPGLYPRAMHYAQLAAGTALISGQKNVELTIGYILLSLYSVPPKRWEEERGWLYLGLAIRCAMDINLHLPNTAKPMNEIHAREMLNRTRVWLNCFNLDRSTGSQYGKPPIINSLDYTANHSEDWWKRSPYNMKHFDIHLCCYNAELRVMAKFRQKIYSDPDHPTGLNKNIDFEKVATETDEELQVLAKKWFAVLDETDLTDVQNCFRTGLLKLAFSYARLGALSFGFQHAFGKSQTDENPFLRRCLAAATEVVNVFVHDIGRPSQRIYVRHGPEAQSVFVTFASAFLIKLLQPKFASYLSYEQRVNIRELVKTAINHMSSAEIAIDDRHSPKLYATFLRGLLSAPMAKLDSPTTPNIRKPPRSKSTSSTQSQPTGSTENMQFTPSPGETTSSLSPYPSQAALSFDQFAPAGAVDPFARLPQTYIGDADNALGLGGVTLPGFFNPSVPYGEDMTRMQPLAGYDWMYPASAGVQDTTMYDNSMQYSYT